jgi:hypothetical protein
MFWVSPTKQQLILLMNQNQLAQFEALTTSLNLNGLDTTNLHHVSLNGNSNNGQVHTGTILTNVNHIQIPIDPYLA